MYKQRTHCAVCDHPSSAPVIDLPKLPLTGLYIDPNTDPASLPKHVREGIDQALLFCENCGHGQLLNVIDSCYIYDDTYTHRGSKSAIATAGNDYFVEFLLKVAPGRIFEKAVDIGCNDLYLLKKVEPLAKHLVGVDPIWKNKDHQCSEKIKVLGGFIEEVDVAKALNGNPDLVISAHTFEHVDDPKTVLQGVVNKAAEGALFVIEVPSFDSLLRGYRFDQIFHQHLHYYSLSSFRRLIQEIGCSYITHAYNYSFWGGTLLMAFKKGRSEEVLPAKPLLEEIRQGYQLFKQQLAYALGSLKYRASPEIYGYGAAQMLPILAYHMNSDLSFLKAILDDNPSRWGLKYPSLACLITPLKDGMSLENSDIFLTALDSARPILRKLAQMKSQRVVLPLNVF